MTNKTVSKDDLQRKRKKYIPKGIGNGNTNIADYARGARVFDNEGREWIDFAGAIGTLNVGHTSKGDGSRQESGGPLPSSRL